MFVDPSFAAFQSEAAVTPEGQNNIDDAFADFEDSPFGAKEPKVNGNRLIRFPNFKLGWFCEGPIKMKTHTQIY